MNEKRTKYINEDVVFLKYYFVCNFLLTFKLLVITYIRCLFSDLFEKHNKLQDFYQFTSKLINSRFKICKYSINLGAPPNIVQYVPGIQFDSSHRKGGVVFDMKWIYCQCCIGTPLIYAHELIPLYINPGCYEHYMLLPLFKCCNKLIKRYIELYVVMAGVWIVLWFSGRYGKLQ